LALGHSGSAVVPVVVPVVVPDVIGSVVVSGVVDAINSLGVKFKSSENRGFYTI